MINPIVRRFTFALVLGVSSFATVDGALAQSKTNSTQSGVTGTDPVPPSCGCKNVAGTAATSTASTAASGSSTAAAVQAVLVLLGLA